MSLKFKVGQLIRDTYDGSIAVVTGVNENDPVDTYQIREIEGAHVGKSGYNQDHWWCADAIHDFYTLHNDVESKFKVGDLITLEGKDTVAKVVDVKNDPSKMYAILAIEGEHVDDNMFTGKYLWIQCTIENNFELYKPTATLNPFLKDMQDTADQLKEAHAKRDALAQEFDRIGQALEEQNDIISELEYNAKKVLNAYVGDNQ